MRNLVVVFYLILWVAAGCKRSEKERIFQEAELSSWDFTQGKIKEVSSLYDQCLTIVAKKELELKKLAGLHRVCNRFYSYADSLGNMYGQWAVQGNYEYEYPFGKLDSLYKLTLDSIPFYYPTGYKPVNFRAKDYRHSAHREAAQLTSMRMLHDVAFNELNVLRHINDNVPAVNRKYPDDGTSPYTMPFYPSAARYGFTVNSKYLQQFPYREVYVDSVMTDGKRVNVKYSVGNRDMLCIVELADLKPGRYQVKGWLWDRPIPHRFEIKKEIKIKK